MTFVLVILLLSVRFLQLHEKKLLLEQRTIIRWEKVFFGFLEVVSLKEINRAHSSDSVKSRFKICMMEFIFIKVIIQLGSIILNILEGEKKRDIFSNDMNVPERDFHFTTLWMG